MGKQEYISQAEALLAQPAYKTMTKRPNQQNQGTVNNQA